MPRKYVVFSTISSPSNSSTAAGSHSHGSGRRYVTASKRPNQLFIYVAAFRIVLELIEARARRRQQHGVARPRLARRMFDRLFESRHQFDLRRVISALVETACYKDYRRRERVDRLDHCADVGSLRVVDISHAAMRMDDFDSMRQAAK